MLHGYKAEITGKMAYVFLLCYNEKILYCSEFMGNGCGNQKMVVSPGVYRMKCKIKEKFYEDKGYRVHR